MKKLMKNMMLSCDKATSLVEKRIYIGLTAAEKLKLVFHTSMCSGCRNYQEQNKLIDKLLKRKWNENSNDATFPTAHLKTSVLKKLGIQ